MVDVLTPEQRKKNMSRIRSKNTSPELKLRKLLCKNDLKGYRLHCDLPGKPDIVFTKYWVVIFVDGCFWHKCPQCFHLPATNEDFWNKKLQKNVERDLRITKELESMGWTVLRIWEHEVNKTPEEVIHNIRLSIMSSVK